MLNGENIINNNELIDKNMKNMYDVIGGEDKRNVEAIFQKIKHNVPLKKLMQDWNYAITKIKDLIM